MYYCRRAGTLVDLSSDSNKSCFTNSNKTVCGAWRYFEGAWVPAPTVCESPEFFPIEGELYTYSALTYNSFLLVPNDSNSASGLGITLASLPDNKLFYNQKTEYAGLPVNMKIFINGTQKATVVITTAFLGDSFKFVDNDIEYEGVFTANGRVNF